MARPRTERQRGPPDPGRAARSTAARRAAPAGDRSGWWADSAVAVGLGAVALAVPLAVLDGAVSPYIDPKAWALQLLVAGTAVAWAAGRGRRPAGAPGALDPDRAARWLRWTLLVYGAWWGVATLASIAPGLSLWGDFGRGDGLLTLGAALALFGLVHAECRTREATDVLVDLALLGSVPVCLLALGQALGWNPFPTTWDPATVHLRVRSTFGQHIFLGSYLILLIPLAAARLDGALGAGRELSPPAGSSRLPWRRGLVGGAWALGAVALVGWASQAPGAWWLLVPWGVLGAAAWTLWRDRLDAGLPPTATVSLLGLLLLGQVLVLILSQARGALLGLIAGLGASGAVLLARRRAWRGLTAGALGLAAVLLFLGVLNLPDSPLAPLKRWPILSRFGNLAETERASPGWVRLQIWRGVLSGWERQLEGEGAIPEASPRFRALVGYGPETQRATVDPLARPFLHAGRPARQRPGHRYLIDRAHNHVLDHLATSGVVGAGLWLGAVGAILMVGVSRIRTGGGAGEVGLRVGCAGAIVAHVVAGQFGIETPASRALFWIVAGLLTAPPWTDAAPLPPSRGSPRRFPWQPALLLGAGVLAVLVAVGASRWLLASVAYANGSRRTSAGELLAARREFRRAAALMPWLALPAEAVADVSYSLAGLAQDPRQRLALLREAETALARARRHARPSADHWALAGQVALGQVMSGEPAALAGAREAYAAALRLRPDDPQVLIQSGLVAVEEGEFARARRLAERALGLDPEPWLAWAVLARSARELDDAATAREAADKARRRAPSEAGALLDRLLP